METVFQKFVLYVASDCVGSEKAKQAIDSFHEDVRIIDVHTLARPLPEWLIGTPTCVDMRSGSMVAHRGTDALALLSGFGSKGYVQQDLPDLPEEEQFDSMSSDKVSDADLDALMKQREQQLVPQRDTQY
uniref:Thioredoxin domain-containing protein n=1 Tax=viral metagenome TaxID=1070528 RepID=A0A6C0KBR5_9ZZZZ